MMRCEGRVGSGRRRLSVSTCYLLSPTVLSAKLPESLDHSHGHGQRLCWVAFSRRVPCDGMCIHCLASFPKARRADSPKPMVKELLSTRERWLVTTGPSYSHVETAQSARPVARGACRAFEGRGRQRLGPERGRLPVSRGREGHADIWADFVLSWWRGMHAFGRSRASAVVDAAIPL